MRISKDKHYVSSVQRYILNILLRTYHLSKHCIMVCGKKEGRGKGRRDCKKEGRRQASGLEGRKKGENREEGRKGGREKGRECKVKKKKQMTNN